MLTTTTMPAQTHLFLMVQTRQRVRIILFRVNRKYFFLDPDKKREIETKVHDIQLPPSYEDLLK